MVFVCGSSRVPALRGSSRPCLRSSAPPRGGLLGISALLLEGVASVWGGCCLCTSSSNGRLIGACCASLSSHLPTLSGPSWKRLWGVATRLIAWVWRPLFFFFFFFQQFITRCSNAVRGPIIQTVRTLRLRYALPVITQPNASGPPSGGQTQAAAHEYSNVTAPFRAVKKSRPPNMGLRTQ
jgi:hypothetical protein